MKHVKLNCGMHSGIRKPGESLDCRKCTHERERMKNRRYRAGLQYGGTPWNVLISGIVGKRVKIAYNMGK